MVTTPTQIWFGRAVFASLSLLVTLAAMLPIGLAAESAVMPDIFFCIAFAWVIRRPQTAPLGLIVCFALLADFLLMRPLGLWTFIILLMSEFVRAQRVPLREQLFVFEWIIFAVVFSFALFVNFMFLKLSFSPTPSFGLMLKYTINTVLAYGVVVAVLHWIFRIRAPKAPGGYKRLGRVA